MIERGYRPPAPKAIVSDNKTKQYDQTFLSTQATKYDEFITLKVDLNSGA